MEPVETRTEWRVAYEQRNSFLSTDEEVWQKWDQAAFSETYIRQVCASLTALGSVRNIRVQSRTIQIGPWRTA